MKFYALMKGNFRNEVSGYVRSGANTSTIGQISYNINTILGRFFLFEDSKGNSCVICSSGTTSDINASFALTNDYVYDKGTNVKYLKVNYTRDDDNQITIWFEKPDGSKVRYISLKYGGQPVPPNEFIQENLSLTRLICRSGFLMPLFYMNASGTSYKPEEVITWNIGSSEIPSFSSSTSTADFNSEIPYTGDYINISSTESSPNISAAVNEIEGLVGNLKNKYISR